MSREQQQSLVIITSSMWNCSEYLRQGRNQEYEKVPVVISPIRFRQSRNDRSTIVAWGCSRGHLCANTQCRYANKDMPVQVL